ncbi:MAG: oligosaccharide flippase family protein [Erythrobacter sp.]
MALPAAIAAIFGQYQVGKLVNHRAVADAIADGQKLLDMGAGDGGYKRAMEEKPAYFQQALVADLLRVQSLIYVTVPFCTLPHAILSRKMDFRRPAQVRLAAAMVGAGTALGMALAGYGVWTLVIAPIAMYLTEGTGMMIAARAQWRPSFRFTGAGHIAGFGGMMTVTQLFWFIQSQADVMIAGRVLDAHLLGVYTTGLLLAQLLAAKFVPPINEVAFAAYSRQQQRGPEPVLATIRLVLLIALQILFSPATNARGLPKVAMQISMLGAVIMPSAFLIGSGWGIHGFAWGWVGGMAVLTLATAIYSGRVLGLTASGLSQAISPLVFAAAMMGGCVFLVRTMLPPMSALAQLALLVPLVPLGAAIYGAVLMAIAPDRLAEALRFARNRGDSLQSAAVL